MRKAITWVYTLQQTITEKGFGFFLNNWFLEIEEEHF